MFATYVPDMKENAEIMHSKEVKEGFFKFSSDVDTIFADGRTGVYSYIIPLGGGDTLLSPSRSSGTIKIGKDTIGTVRIGTNTFTVNLVNVSYTPLLSFWENQGYSYKKGVVNVTKGVVEVPALEGSIRSLNTFFTGMKPELTHSWTSDGRTHYDYAMNIVTFEPGTAVYASGNGDAVLRIESTKEQLGPYSSSEVYVNGVNQGLSGDCRIYVTKTTTKVSVT
jgi:hypothetical protein